MSAHDAFACVADSLRLVPTGGCAVASSHESWERALEAGARVTSDRVFINVGANKGYAMRAWLELWAHVPSSNGWYQLIAQYAREQHERVNVPRLCAPAPPGVSSSSLYVPNPIAYSRYARPAMPVTDSWMPLGYRLCCAQAARVVIAMSLHSSRL
eukprot:1607738-Prymnesium_polylepis.1